MGRTALHHASGAGDLVSIMALLDAGADVNQQDYSGKTPLHWASMNEHDSTSY
jgi:ankyrin repeat protein